MRESIGLQLLLALHELLFANGQLRPSAEDLAGGGTGAALQLGFDGPGEGGAVVFGEQDVGAEGVEVFGVEQQAVHVEETGADGCWWSHCWYECGNESGVSVICGEDVGWYLMLQTLESEHL